MVDVVFSVLAPILFLPPSCCDGDDVVVAFAVLVLVHHDLDDDLVCGDYAGFVSFFLDDDHFAYRFAARSLVALVFLVQHSY